VVTRSVLPLARGEYHGLARRDLTPPRFLMRPLLNGGTLGGRIVFRSADRNDANDGY
jgi:hypothetical protein